MIQRLICIGLLAAAPLAWGQSTPAASAPPSSPAKKELVAKVVTLQQQGIEGIAQALAQQPVQRMMQAAAQALNQVPQDKREAASKAVDAKARKYLDETIPFLRERAVKLAPATLGPTLEEKFSEDELRQLVAWLDSPTNKKYQQVAPDLQQMLAQKVVADTRGTIEPKLKTLEERVAGALGLQRPAAASAPAPASAASKAPAKSKP